MVIVVHAWWSVYISWRKTRTSVYRSAAAIHSRMVSSVLLRTLPSRFLRITLGEFSTIPMFFIYSAESLVNGGSYWTSSQTLRFKFPLPGFFLVRRDPSNSATSSASFSNFFWRVEPEACSTAYSLITYSNLLLSPISALWLSPSLSMS